MMRNIFMEGKGGLKWVVLLDFLSISPTTAIRYHGNVTAFSWDPSLLLLISSQYNHAWQQSTTTTKTDFLAYVSLLNGFHFSPRCRHRQWHWKAGKNEHHLWKKRDSAGSGRTAFNLVRI
ncbi:hypothetical protein Goari_016616, partial [Gossypium aridum]|nr:hypothetical protein [Gossypium aridum]